jgi:hypothetical protein
MAPIREPPDPDPKPGISTKALWIIVTVLGLLLKYGIE